MVRARTPGRVNLIGEHTDHQGGYVLPVALPLQVRVDVEPRDDLLVRASSDEIGGPPEDRSLDPARPAGTWADHVVGPGAILRERGLIDRGYDAHVRSDLPMGAGLGSSGALGVAVLRALRDAFGIAIDDVEVARLAQRSENEFAGAGSGIMDQMAASVGREGEALFLDCRTLAFERIPLPERMEILVVHSGIVHRHAGPGPSPYNVRRSECEDAARALGIAQLRDAGPADRKRIAALPEPLRRRARHVVSENARVLGAVAALREADLDGLGKLLDGSHRSLRDDFEVSTPEVDVLVELVREQDGVGGARICGGGFGGSIIAIAEPGQAHRAGAVAVAEYEQRTGRDARILLPVAAEGAL